MSRIDGLPHGACSRVAARLEVSERLVQLVAQGKRDNVIVEEALLAELREHQARMKRIERMKAKMKEYRFGDPAFHGGDNTLQQ